MVAARAWLRGPARRDRFSPLECPMTMTSPLLRRTMAGLAMMMPLGAAPPAAATLADGVYLVLKQAPEREALADLKDDETIVADREPFQKVPPASPVRYLVVHRVADVPLALAGKPTAVKDEAGSLRVQLKLAKPAADKLARLTREHVGSTVAIVIGGEVATAHKVREAIKDGRAQITSCSPGGAEYLLTRLQAASAGK
jgi:preprotein translocase subunit SecD